MAGRLPYSWLEREAAKEGQKHLSGPLHGLDQASELVASLMEPLDAPPAPREPPTPEYWIRTAVLNIAAVGVRAARAVKVLVEAGYAPESVGSLRNLHEAIQLITWVSEDSSGQRAENWLTNNASKKLSAARIAAAAGVRGAYDAMSKRAHVTQLAAQEYHRKVESDGRHPVTVVPEHRLPYSAEILFATMEQLLALHGLLRDVWDADTADESLLASLRAIQQVDGWRYRQIEELLAPAGNPYVVSDE